MRVFGRTLIFSNCLPNILSIVVASSFSVIVHFCFTVFCLLFLIVPWNVIALTSVEHQLIDKLQ